MTYTSTTLAPEDAAKIAAFLDAHPTLSRGVGNAETMCSVAAMNLALTGELTDARPACMSPVVHAWIIRVQDAMPAKVRNSQAWRDLLPAAAGSNDGRDKERRAILLNWMWGTVLPTVQPIADKRSFGTEWALMLREWTPDAAWAARKAARAAAAAAAAFADDADDDDAADAAAAAAFADDADAAAADDAAAFAAAFAADAAFAAGEADARDKAWKTFDPVVVLAQLVSMSTEETR